MQASGSIINEIYNYTYWRTILWLISALKLYSQNTNICIYVFRNKDIHTPQHQTVYRISNLFNLPIYITNVDFDRSFIESDIMLYFKFKDHFKATFYCLSIFLLGFWSFAIFLEAEINDCYTKLRSEGAGDKELPEEKPPCHIRISLFEISEAYY